MTHIQVTTKNVGDPLLGHSVLFICLSVFLSVKAFCTIVYLHVYMCVSVPVFLVSSVL